MQRLLARAAREIDDDAALVTVEACEILVVRTKGAGTDRARDVALARLDLDHVGAKIGQQQAAIGPRQHVADLEDADAGERAAHHSASANEASASVSAISLVKMRRTPSAISSSRSRVELSRRRTTECRWR